MRLRLARIPQGDGVAVVPPVLGYAILSSSVRIRVDLWHYLRIDTVFALDRRPHPLKRSSAATIQAFAIVAIYFFSGATSLVYEVLWQRLLKLVLGNTTYATGITTAVFMGGLALGSFLIRKKADAFPNKLLAYGLIELLVALFAALVPLFLRGMDSAYIHIYQSWGPPPAVMLLLQILCSSAILAFPSMLLGSTLPILAGLLSRDPASIGRKTGLLYSLNTLGACAGAAAAGFFLIRLLGVYPTYYGAVTLNLCVAAAAFLLSRTVRESSLEPSAASPKQGDGQDRRVSPSRALVSYWLFVIGFAALGYEILWVRTIVHLLNADTYSFASVLCTYLVGYAAGVFVGGRLAGRPARAVPLFCLFAQLIGMAGLLYFPLITHLLDIEVLWRFPLVQSLTISVPYFGHLYVCALLFLVPSFCMGGFPLLVQIERAWFGKTGRTVSHAFTINTIGCVAGALLTAFFLIPAFGSQRAMLALGVAALVSGGLGAFVVRGRTAKVLYIVILAGGLATAFFEPADSFANWST